MKKTIMFVWKLFAGALLCSFIGSSVAVVGWTYQAMRRRARKAWHRAADAPFDEPWPSWIVRPGAAGWRRLIGGLVTNFRIGAQGIFNTWVVTLPGCVLWLFAWWAGWNNSFNKGYEQAWVGPAVGWLGAMLFIAAMFYVPMAQARQASTGNWRSFYHYGAVRAVIRNKWFACLWLAVAYALVSVPVMVLKTAPVGFGDWEKLKSLTDEQAMAFLGEFFFWACVFVFPAMVLLRLLAARIYAGGLLGALHAGEISPDQLAPDEAAVLDELDLAKGQPQPQRHVLMRISINMTNRAARFACGTLAAIVWFVFVFQIFVSEFMNYHPVIGWLNQPLVQLPWFKYMP